MKPINKAGVSNYSQKVSEISKNILPGKFKNEHTAINERICSKKPLMRQSRTALPSPAKERSHLIADADKYDDGLERMPNQSVDPLKDVVILAKKQQSVEYNSNREP